MKSKKNETMGMTQPSNCISTVWRGKFLLLRVWLLQFPLADTATAPMEIGGELGRNTEKRKKVHFRTLLRIEFSFLLQDYLHWNSVGATLPTSRFLAASSSGGGCGDGGWVRGTMVNSLHIQ